MNRYMQYRPQQIKIAYFTMEIGLGPEMPIYSGGLGVLAGDTIKTFADLSIPAVCVTLLSEKGYFYQDIDESGNQIETLVNWPFQKHMALLSDKITLRLEGRTIVVQVWVHEITGVSGWKVPVLFLDTNVDANSADDRNLTRQLYGGDARYRLMQEAVLGLAGVRMLQILDHDNLQIYHMNEGHAALLTLELMDRYAYDLEKVRKCCVFTTHTPVPAGHDRFDIHLVKQILDDFVQIDDLRHDNIIDAENKLNMTYLALYHSEYINGVAKMHGETAQKMFPQYRIDAITNGVHIGTWASDDMKNLFNRYISNWRNDPYSLRSVLRIPPKEICQAHRKAKERLIEFIKNFYGVEMSVDILTIGFARRSTAYKRPDLIFSDLERLKSIAAKAGRIQLIYGGKAHPKDESGRALIKKIWGIMKELNGHIQIVYLKNYDMYSAKLLVTGVDVWLNTPIPPMEASGTSGMKAALNGVINFSVLDGWWIEGHIENFTGWSIGPCPEAKDSAPSPQNDSDDLYQKLENNILPMYYNNQKQWTTMMINNIAINGSFFNTHRMVSQYVTQAYFD